MPRVRTDYFKAHKQKLRYTAKGRFGYKCVSCGSKDSLEFAHKQPCLKGRGRGSQQRIIEVNKNPDKFILLCSYCHRVYDQRLYALGISSDYYINIYKGNTLILLETVKHDSNTI